jgi:hypothetical protein
LVNHRDGACVQEVKIDGRSAAHNGERRTLAMSSAGGNEGHGSSPPFPNKLLSFVAMAMGCKPR